MEPGFGFHSGLGKGPVESMLPTGYPSHPRSGVAVEHPVMPWARHFSAKLAVNPSISSHRPGKYGAQQGPCYIDPKFINWQKEKAVIPEQ